MYAVSKQLIAPTYFPTVPFPVAIGGSEWQNWSWWDCLRKELVMSAFPVQLFPFYSYGRLINTLEKAGA